MISIMLVSKQERVLGVLRNCISLDDEFELVAEASGGDQALEKIENIGPNILVVNSSAADADALNLAERVVMRKPRTFVVLLIEENNLETIQKANAAGVHNICLFPTDGKEFCSYLQRVYNSESSRIAALSSNERVTWSSKVISIYGAKGGLGKTTLATNLAIKLASKNKKVCIIDMDLQFGDVQVFMDLDPKETISDLVQDMSTPTIDSIRSYMNIHSSGVHVLCAPKSPEYADLISADRIEGLLGLLRGYYDYVIIDTGANFADTTLTALEASTTILFVTGLDISILKNSKVALGILDSLNQKRKVRVIINRAVEINTITIADVQRIVDAPILARIPSDYMIAVAALNQGQPFVLSAPKSKLSLAISDMATNIDSGADNFDLQSLTPKERKALMKKYRTKERSEKKSLFRRK